MEIYISVYNSAHRFTCEELAANKRLRVVKFEQSELLAWKLLYFFWMSQINRIYLYVGKKYLFGKKQNSEKKIIVTNMKYWVQYSFIKVHFLCEQNIASLIYTNILPYDKTV